MLELQHLDAGYDSTRVLHSVSMHGSPHGIAAILGHNGAGKTTMLRAAIGLIRPSRGRVLFEGEDVTALSPSARVRRGMAYVPQGQQSFEQLTTRENLQVVADRRRGPRRAQLVDDALGRFPALTEVIDRRAGLLSGGQRQQLAIARALITEPKLLILDEPTEGIQPSVVAEIEQTIIGLSRDEGLSVLLAVQHIDFALHAAERYAVLAAGRVTRAGAGGAEAQRDVRDAMAI
ncbi:ATP-binding cassette domain-containing protein [Nesterenkonia sp. HG001]|uniref:ATP-binding cassette domain-containing protein n=1 Tax=Nesterenkonia sp. HG001 TaxID=2983207 RepID=UPI002AC5D1E9|nr:ATP-binding cassette domain-containing protein [Nesterenkonia sp. HG001]MDZ5076680.1 ATP-binding cassette domain-containing protein [Nesterenkonia sp. HG001]